MSDNNIKKLLIIATLTGLFGDILLQTMINNNIADWGLKPYFEQHGRAESSIIGAGIMALFYSIYAMTGLPFKIQYMIIYGLIIDLLFRHLSIFPSLKMYYKKVGYFGTVVVGAIIPLIIPLLIMKSIDKRFKII
jgi:hypothetical protein